MTDFLTNMTVREDALDPAYLLVEINFQGHVYNFSIPDHLYPDELAFELRKAADWLEKVSELAA